MHRSSHDGLTMREPSDARIKRILDWLNDIYMHPRQAGLYLKKRLKAMIRSETGERAVGKPVATDITRIFAYIPRHNSSHSSSVTIAHDAGTYATHSTMLWQSQG